METPMTTAIYFTTIGIIVGTILLVFGMKYVSAAYQARARIQGEAAYRELADKAVTAQFQNTASLTAMAGEIAKIAAQLAGVEKILKEVE
jgi:uncharacterized membrane protein